MAKTGCRDCSNCTESLVTSTVLIPARVVGGIVGGLTVNLFKRKCPQCKHLMQYHRKVGAGDRRFED
jgi:hypothetical protein